MKMDFKYPVLAKPSGITLEQHRFNVMSEAQLFAARHPFVFEKYEGRIHKSLEQRLLKTCELHDDGKESEWNDACRKDYKAYLAWQAKNGYASFRDYSILVSQKAVENIRTCGMRHEIKSMRLAKQKKCPYSLLAAIAAHHGKLCYEYEERWNKEAKEEWIEIQKHSNKFVYDDSIEKTANRIYEYSAIRGLLQLVDHRASAKEENESVPDFQSFVYQFPYVEKRIVQQLVEKYSEKELLLLRAHTGAGKTDAALLWASLQIRKKRADRLVIAMPTRFTSNALSISVSQNLSETGLYHSSAWYVKFQNKINANELSKHTAEKMHEFARLLETPVTVCTIDHLLMALTLTREDHHLIAFNMANSCLVIDEADFYDEFTQTNMLVLLKILKQWDVPVLIMSASLPEITIEEYKKTGYKIDGIVEDSSDENRERFELKEMRDYSCVDEVEDLLLLMLEQKTGIIYANTIDHALAFYNWFKEHNTEKLDVILYHSRFTEPDKERKENELITLLGKDAWLNNRAKGIAILTQIGEMSINISCDIMISDLCPIDRLIQRTGRLCRFNSDRIGCLYLLKPLKDELFYPAPYGEYDKRMKLWNPCAAITRTADFMKNMKYSSKLLIELLNIVYDKSIQYSSVAKKNADELQDYFRNNWLIRPKEQTNQDDNVTAFWKSRNMLPQNLVFVQIPPYNGYFINRESFNEWKIAHSIEIPSYLIKKGKEQHILDLHEILVGSKKEIIYVLREGFYNYDEGIIFINKDNIFI